MQQNRPSGILVQFAFFRGFPDSEEALVIARNAVKRAEVVMVVEDSSHQDKVVLRNMESYWQFVTPGSYLIVQDTRLKWSGKGPLAAISTFMGRPGGSCFRKDYRLEHLIYTQHFDGYLQRLSQCEATPL